MLFYAIVILIGCRLSPSKTSVCASPSPDPDITKGDGIYSRYLPTLHGYPGRYLLSADIDYNSGMAVIAKGPPTRHHKGPSSHLAHYYQHPNYDNWNSEQTCCGSAVPHVHTRRAPPFLRHETWGVLEVVAPPPPRDNVPPSRILDLKVDVNDTVHEISLRWTAPGDDWDNGRAHHYEAVVAPYWREARAFQGDRLTGLPTPLTAGTMHATTLQFTRYEEVRVLSLRRGTGSLSWPCMSFICTIKIYILSLLSRFIQSVISILSL